MNKSISSIIVITRKLLKEIPFPNDLDIKKHMEENKEEYKNFSFIEVKKLVEKLIEIDKKRKEKLLINIDEIYENSKEETYEEPTPIIETEHVINNKYIKKGRTFIKKTVKNLKIDKNDFKKIANKILKFFIKIANFIWKLFVSLLSMIVKIEPNMDEIFIKYKIQIQEKLNKVYNELNNKDSSEQILLKAEKNIIKLTNGDGFPKLNLGERIFFGFETSFLNIKALILILFVNTIFILFFKHNIRYENLLWFLIFFNSFLYYIHYSFIEKELITTIKENKEFRDFLWKDFKGMKGIRSEYNEIFNTNPKEKIPQKYVEEPVRERPAREENVITNNYLSKEWSLIQKELFQVKEGEVIIPKIIEVFDKTEIHVISHRKIPYEKLVAKRLEMVQYLNREIYQIIPKYKGEIRDIGVELITKPLPEFYKLHEVPKPSKPSSIIVGLDAKGWIEWNFDTPITPHGVIAGTSGSGKSVLMYHLIDQFIKQNFMLFLADPKLVSFGRYEKRGYEIAYDNHQIMKLISDLHDEMNWRNNLFLKNDCEKISEYNETVSNEKQLPRIVCIIDEFATLSGDEENFKLIKNKYIQILRKGRSAGVHMIIALQEPLANSIGGSMARALMQYKIAGLLSEPKYSEFMLGDKDARATMITSAGTFYVNDASKQNCYQIKTPFIDSKKGEVNELIEKTPYNPYKNYKLHIEIPTTELPTIDTNENNLDEIEVPKLPSSKYEKKYNFKDYFIKEEE